MVPIWFGLCTWLFKRLETLYPETFESLGSPHLVGNNTPITSGKFLSFLAKSGWQSLDDPVLARFGRFMQVFFVIFMICFVALLAAIVFVHQLDAPLTTIVK